MNETTYFRAEQSCGGQRFLFQTGPHIYVVTGAIPAGVRDLEALGLLSRLPDPGPLRPWFELTTSFHEVEEAAFSPLPAPREPVFISRAEVLTRTGFDLAQLQIAIHQLGFPRHVRVRNKVNDDGTETPIDWFWTEDDVANWERNRKPALQSMFASAGR